MVMKRKRRNLSKNHDRLHFLAYRQAAPTIMSKINSTTIKANPLPEEPQEPYDPPEPPVSQPDPP